MFLWYHIVFPINFFAMKSATCKIHIIPKMLISDSIKIAYPSHK